MDDHDLDIYMDAPPAAEPVLLDRSTLERYGQCPFQGLAVETGRVADESLEAVTGTEVHRVIAEAVDQYARDGVPLRDYLEQEVVKTRPDVQPETITGLRRSVWAIDRLLTSRHPNDVIAYQGGGDRGSQLAAELLPANDSRGAITPTSEIDLLLAGTTDVELVEVDWKSGHKEWTSADVKNAFQFLLHAWLVFRNYPDCQQLHVQVWMTRFNQVTPAVTFTRADAERFEGRLLQIVEFRRQAREALEFDCQPECWPEAERCGRCPAVLLCPLAYAPAPEIAASPVTYAKNTMLLQNVVGKRLEALRTHVEANGEIRDGAGFAYGCNEPKAARRKPAKDYKAYVDPAVEPDERAEIPDDFTDEPYLAALGQELKKGQTTDNGSATDGAPTN